MSDNPAVVIHFRDCEQDDGIKDSIEKHSARLSQEFREISRIEISLERNEAISPPTAT